jgi:hypothetical protein
MKNLGLILGIITLLLGVVIAITPHYIFPVCEYSGMSVETAAGMLIPMRCLYTAYAETGVGAAIIAVGAIHMVSGQSETRKALSIVSAVLGILVILFPIYLIGVCRTPTMPCRTGTQPTLIVLGVSMIIVSAIGFFMSMRNEE